MVQDFLFEYFCKPVVERGGYNIVNTVVYVIILLLISFFVVYPLLHRRGIKFNLKFMLALMPYVVFGSTFRVLEDLQILPRSCNPLELGFYTYTPGIYFVTFAVTIAMLALSMKISKKWNGDFYRLFGCIGIIIMVPVVAFLLLNLKAWEGFALTLFLVLLIAGIVWIAMKKIRKEFFADKLNLLVVASQALDGSATVVATNFYRCSEQHVLSNVVLDLHPAAFIVLKVLLALLIVYYVDKEIKNENLRGFIKVFLIILGFATGTRDLFSLGTGVCL